MTNVIVALSAPWPTAAGLRRPQEGLIALPAEVGEAIEQAGAGEIVAIEEEAAKPAPAPSRRRTPAKPKPESEPAQ